MHTDGRGTTHGKGREIRRGVMMAAEVWLWMWLSGSDFQILRLEFEFMDWITETRGYKKVWRVRKFAKGVWNGLTQIKPLTAVRLRKTTFHGYLQSKIRYPNRSQPTNHFTSTSRHSHAPEKVVDSGKPYKEKENSSSSTAALRSVTTREKI